MAEFTEDELAAEAATADTVESAPVARDEQGRFAPVEQIEADPVEEAPHQQQRTVPHAALHAEREGHKATKAELLAARERLSQIDALRDRLAASRATPEPQQAPVQQDDDPSGLKHLQERLAGVEATQRQRVEQEQDMGIAQQERQTLFTGLSQSEAAFRTQTPDYDQAAQHLAQARIRQLQMMGLDHADIQQTLADEVLEITRAAIQQGREPAEVAYQWAQTYGYAPQAQQQQAVNPMLAAIAQGQKQSRSLANARGGASASEVNANAAGAMSEDDFVALYSTPEGRKLIDAMG